MSPRAPSMPPDDRRDLIVRAAIPLIAEFGAAVTTARIARAAGVAEGTIYNVFAGKAELIEACVIEVVRADDVLADIAAISLDLPLATRLTEALQVMDAYLDRLGAVLGALHGTGGPRRSGPDAAHPRGNAREDALAAGRDAIARLLEPDADRLRSTPAQLADVFQRLAFARTRIPASEGVGPGIPDLVDIFLNGAVKA